MAYDTWEAARLVSWSNKQAGMGPLTEAELTQWIDDGVGLLEWADVLEEDGEVTKYIDFPYPDFVAADLLPAGCRSVL